MAHLAKGNWTALGYHRRLAVGTPQRGELHVGLPAGLGSDTSCAHRAAGAALHELISAAEADMLTSPAQSAARREVSGRWAEPPSEFLRRHPQRRRRDTAIVGLRALQHQERVVRAG